MTLPIDTLNDLLVLAEARIAAFGWGVSASVRLKDGVLLTYKKHNGKARLYVLYAHASTGHEMVLLVESPKTIRYLAAQRLHDLVDALRVAREDDLTQVRAACAEVESFLCTTEPTDRKE